LGMVFYLVAFLLRRRAPPSTPFPYPPLSRSLQVLPAQSAGATPKIITLVRNEIKLEERAAQGKLMEVPTKDGTRRIGVVKLPARSEEHTSELQSRENLVCRLLLEKKKSNQKK